MKLAIVMLAAGRSRRAGGVNKLLARDRCGRSMIGCSVETALRTSAEHVLVVLGHQADDVAAVLQGLVHAESRLELIRTTQHTLGLSASLHAGIRRARALNAEAAIVCLGDMPLVRAETIDRLAARLAEEPSSLACVPTVDGKDGNPVAWRAALFDALLAVTGDRGGRGVLRHHQSSLRRLPVDDRGVLEDFDSPERLAEFAALRPDWT